MNIAIIGAGLSGSNAYSLLKQKGYKVTIFDKARGAGGRCNTRYVDDKLIDFGTPYFEANNIYFKEFCNKKIEEGLLQKKDEIYYPKKGMNKLCSSVIEKNDFYRSCKIISAKFENQKWQLIDENNSIYEDFTHLIITIPATQILQMNISLPINISKMLKNVTYDSVGALMMYSLNNSNSLIDKLKEHREYKIVDNSFKYNYRDFYSYVIHLSEELTAKQDFKSKDELEQFIVSDISKNMKLDIKKEFTLLAHFWKYAFTSNFLDLDYIYEQSINLGICGDYFNGVNLQTAYLSSRSLVFEKFS